LVDGIDNANNKIGARAISCYPDKTSDRDPTFSTRCSCVRHGLATFETQCEVSAIAAIEIRYCPTPRALILQLHAVLLLLLHHFLRNFQLFAYPNTIWIFSIEIFSLSTASHQQSIDGSFTTSSYSSVCCCWRLCSRHTSLELYRELAHLNLGFRMMTRDGGAMAVVKSSRNST
jgi:hypothetical protein